MLKKSLITVVLLCLYLSLILVLSQLGFNDAINIIVSSVLFGSAMHVLLNELPYLVLSIATITLLFVLLQDYTSIPMMLSSVLFGHIMIHYRKNQKQRQQRARRRPLNENREFLN